MTETQPSTDWALCPSHLHIAREIERVALNQDAEQKHVNSLEVAMAQQVERYNHLIDVVAAQVSKAHAPGSCEQLQTWRGSLRALLAVVGFGVGIVAAVIAAVVARWLP